MTLPIFVQPQGDQFSASLLGMPVQVIKPTRTLAMQALKSQIEQHIILGEIQFIDVPRPNLAQLAGKYADDPTLQQICDEAYDQRDADRGK